MPSPQIQKRPSEPHPFDKGHPHAHDDPHLPNNGHWVHKEALRVAIGSILTPKRPPFPQGSRSTSGTASPYSFPTSSSHTPGTGTPVHPPFGPSEYLHPHHAFIPHHNHNHHHTPSRLAHSTSHSPPGGSSSNSGNNSPASAQPSAGCGIPEPLQLPAAQNENVIPTRSASTPGASRGGNGEAFNPQARPTVTPLQPTPNGTGGKANSSPGDLLIISNNGEKMVVSPSGRVTPRAKFIEKLQSKSAWDALIHGSFSLLCDRKGCVLVDLMLVFWRCISTVSVII